MELKPYVKGDEHYFCETCQKRIDGRWYGIVEEYDQWAIYLGYSYQCPPCLNVLANMALSLGELEGPNGPISGDGWSAIKEGEHGDN
jgi:hypothetical protein